MQPDEAQQAPATASPAPVKSKKKKYTIIGIISFVVVLVAAALGWCGYYANRALPGTKVGNVKIAGLTAAQASEKLSKEANTARITLKAPAVADAPAVEKQYGYAQLGTKVNVNKTISEIYQIHKHSFLAPLNFFGTHQYDAAVTSDINSTDLLQQFPELEKLQVKPVNATISLNTEDGKFTVADGKNGKTVDVQAIAAQAEKAAKTLSSTTITVSLADREPAFNTAAAKNWTKLADEALKANVTLVLPPYGPGEPRKTRASAAEIGSWLVNPGEHIDPATVDQDELEKAVKTLHLNKDRVEAWVNQKSMAGATTARPGKRTVDAAGKELFVIQDPIPGNAKPNTAELTQDIIKGLENPATAKLDNLQVKLTGDPVKWQDIKLTKQVSYTTWPYNAAPDQLWVDVNLSTREVTVFRGKTQVYGPVSMVPGAPATPTVQGTFKIYLKNQTQTLRGTNVDGSQYVTPDVPWIMYFHGGYALHGAPWRSAFGFNASGGSHGCVNLPVPVAHDLFEMVPLGTVVRVHT